MKDVVSAESNSTIVSAVDSKLSPRSSRAMDIRVSVQAMIQQLIHEQARATVHLEGLQRDVSTLLDFRDHLLDSLPRPHHQSSTPTSSSGDPAWPVLPGASTSSNSSRDPPPWKPRDSGFGDPGGENPAGSGENPAGSGTTSGGAGGSNMAAAPSALRHPHRSRHHDLANLRQSRSSCGDASCVDSTSKPYGYGLGACPQSEPDGVGGESASLPGNDLASGGGNSTSGVGTSVGATGLSAGCCSTEDAAISSNPQHHTLSTASSRTGTRSSSDDDELLRLLEVIEVRGRQLKAENRQLVHTIIQQHDHQDATSLSQEAQAASPPAPAAFDDNITLQCRYCERPLPASSSASAVDLTRFARTPPQIPNVAIDEILSPDVDRYRLSHGDQDISPLKQRLSSSSRWLSPLSPPDAFSLPVYRQRSTAASGAVDRSSQLQRHRCKHRATSDAVSDAVVPSLTQVEQMMQERGLLVERLLDTELMAARAHSQTANMQSRLRTLSVVNEELRRELRVQTTPTKGVSSSTSSNFSSTNRVLEPQRRPPPRTTSTPDLRPPSRIPQPLSLRRRVDSRPSPTHSSPTRPSPSSPRINPTVAITLNSSRDADTQTSFSSSPAVALSESVRRQLQLVSGSVRDGTTDRGSTDGTAATPLPCRERVEAVLREKEPLQLQRQLLLLLVDAESLRNRLESSGRDWTQASHELTTKIAGLQERNEELESELSLERGRRGSAPAELRRGSTRRVGGVVSPCRPRTAPSTPVSSSSSVPPPRSAAVRTTSSGSNLSSSSSLRQLTATVSGSNSSLNDRSLGASQSSIPVLVRCHSPSPTIATVLRSASPSVRRGSQQRGSASSTTVASNSSGASPELATVKALRGLLVPFSVTTTVSANPTPTPSTGTPQLPASASTAAVEVCDGALQHDQQDVVEHETTRRRKDWRSSFPSVAGSGTTSSGSLQRHQHQSVRRQSAPVFSSTAAAGDPPSSKIPPTQSQAIGQILTALSRPGSSVPTPSSAAPSGSAVGFGVAGGQFECDEYEEEEDEEEVGSSLEPPSGRLRLRQSLQVEPSHFGYKYGGSSASRGRRSGSDPALMTPNQGLIRQILANRQTPPTSTSDSAHSPQTTSYVTSPVSGSPVAMTTRQPRAHKLSAAALATSSSLPATTAANSSANSSTAGKESGNARVGRYIRSLLHRISEMPDHQQ